MVPAYSDHFGAPDGCHSIPTVQHRVCVAGPCVNGMSPVSARSQCGATVMGHWQKVPMVLGPCPQYLQHEVPTIPSQRPSWIWHTVSMLGPHTAGTVAPVAPAQCPLCPQHLQPGLSLTPAQCPQRPQLHVPNISSLVSPVSPARCPRGPTTERPHSFPLEGLRTLQSTPKHLEPLSPRVRDP